MSTQHTPGPWTVPQPIVRSGGLAFSPVFATTLIAKVYSTAFGDDDQATANACLMAAAPELLEALWVCCEHNRLHFGDAHNTVIKARAGMSTQHTPGPWTVPQPIVRSGGLAFSPVFATTLIAKVYSTAFGDDDQATANACLMAAAPELLEALWVCCEHNRLHFGDAHNTVIKARAAIAKAIGEPT